MSTRFTAKKYTLAKLVAALGIEAGKEGPLEEFLESYDQAATSITALEAKNREIIEESATRRAALSVDLEASEDKLRAATASTTADAAELEGYRATSVTTAKHGALDALGVKLKPSLKSFLYDVVAPHMEPDGKGFKVNNADGTPALDAKGQPLTLQLLLNDAKAGGKIVSRTIPDAFIGTEGIAEDEGTGGLTGGANGEDSGDGSPSVAEQDAMAERLGM